MAKLVFDKTGEKTYETGVSNCVLYVRKDAERREKYTKYCL